MRFYCAAAILLLFGRVANAAPTQPAQKISPETYESFPSAKQWAEVLRVKLNEYNKGAPYSELKLAFSKGPSEPLEIEQWGPWNKQIDDEIKKHWHGYATLGALAEDNPRWKALDGKWDEKYSRGSLFQLNVGLGFASLARGKAIVLIPKFEIKDNKMDDTIDEVHDDPVLTEQVRSLMDNHLVKDIQVIDRSRPTEEGAYFKRAGEGDKKVIDWLANLSPPPVPTSPKWKIWLSKFWPKGVSTRPHPVLHPLEHYGAVARSRLSPMVCKLERRSRVFDKSTVQSMLKIDSLLLSLNTYSAGTYI